jgi:hypothetical protein
MKEVSTSQPTIDRGTQGIECFHLPKIGRDIVELAFTFEDHPIKTSIGVVANTQTDRLVLPPSKIYDSRLIEGIDDIGPKGGKTDRALLRLMIGSQKKTPLTFLETDQLPLPSRTITLSQKLRDLRNFWMNRLSALAFHRSKNEKREKGEKEDDNQEFQQRKTLLPPPKRP